MTDIEKKAQALLNEVCAERGQGQPFDHFSRADHTITEALCRAIEQHEAFRQEVSDAVEAGKQNWPGNYAYFADALEPFIIAKPVDQFVALVGEAVWSDPNEPDAVDCAASILEALAKRGGKIVWEND